MKNKGFGHPWKYIWKGHLDTHPKKPNNITLEFFWAAWTTLKGNCRILFQPLAQAVSFK